MVLIMPALMLRLQASAPEEKGCCMVEAHKGLAISIEETVPKALARGSYSYESLSEQSHCVEDMTRKRHPRILRTRTSSH